LLSFLQVILLTPDRQLGLTSTSVLNNHILLRTSS
jgi:hypothetical protein